MNVWWCNQSGQWDVERPEGVVCSNDSSRGGRESGTGPLLLNWGQKAGGQKAGQVRYC